MAPPVLKAITTTALLNDLQAKAQLPRALWYCIAGVTLSALNRPHEVSTVFLGALSSAREDAERALIARRLRESLIKSSVIVGLPKTINSLTILKTNTPEKFLDLDPDSCPSGRSTELRHEPGRAIIDRGLSFFDRTYGKISTQVMAQLDHCGTPDLGVVARLLYGHVLSNTSVLSAADTSHVMLAGLIPQEAEPQLKGHLKGALNNGATVNEVRAVTEVVLTICTAAGMEGLKEAITRFLAKHE